MAPQTSEAYEASCAVCKEVITHPVCPVCLEQEMMDWLMEKKESKLELMNFVRQTAKAFWPNEEAGTACIICRKKMMICAHCYCSEIFDYINGRYPELEEEFITHFDFNIHFKIGIT